MSLPSPLPGVQLAKTSGVSLQDHTRNVCDQADAILSAFPGAVAEHDRQTGGDLGATLRKAALVHDLGKKHPDWQQACRDDRRQGRGSNLMRAGLRHEFASPGYAEAKGVPLTFAERVAVLAHHGKLSRRFAHRWREDGGGAFSDEWGQLVAVSDKRDGRRGYEKWRSRLLARYELAGPRALLRLADVRASRAEGRRWNPDLSDLSFNIKEHFPDRKPVQEKALELAKANADVSVLRAPTGSGKTYASVLWAEEHVRAGRADRLVIAMPTRFTSNALAVGLEARLGDAGLYHSSAWNVRYGDLTDEEAIDRAEQMQRLAYLLATPATVCTVDHLLMALTGAREDHHAVLFFLASAAVVVDEADFYDPFVQANLKVLLDALRVLEVPVLVMSATVPDAAATFYGAPGGVAEAEQEDEPERSLAYLGTYEAPDDVADVLREMLDAETGIVYCNTVARALAMYRWLTDEAHNPDGVPVLFYHSRFTEPDKKAREEEITAALGRDAWESGTARGIAVLTQIGEMSVNISAPLMLSELCPWDRLAQRAGRLSRFNQGDRGGRLVVVTPTKQGELYPAPYGSPNRGRGWIPARALTETRDEIERDYTETPRRITSADFADAVNRLYPEPESLGTTAEANQTALLRLMDDNWLIQPGEPFKCDPADDDSAEVGTQWRARDIPPQVVVLTERPDDRYAAPTPDDFSHFVFESYPAFRRCVDAIGVSVPVGLREKEERTGRGRLVPFRYAIGKDSIRREQVDGVLYLVTPPPVEVGPSTQYEPAVGLAWLGENDGDLDDW